jgi:hypothetical protein
MQRFRQSSRRRCDAQSPGTHDPVGGSYTSIVTGEGGADVTGQTGPDGGFIVNLASGAPSGRIPHNLAQAGGVAIMRLAVIWSSAD